MPRVSTMETIPYPFSHLASLAFASRNFSVSRRPAKLNTVFARKNFCVKSTFDKLIGGRGLSLNGCFFEKTGQFD